jgi:nitroreductase/NAD-dependent dihydropyrimidine dehydrogenase PreA subunit
VTDIQLDHGLCVMCQACVKTCPATVFSSEQPDGIPEIDNMDRCISCGHCLAVCPVDAITHSRLSPERIHKSTALSTPGFEQLQALFQQRRSIRVFTDRPVDDDIVGKLINAAVYAPSAHNSQSTEYIVLSSSDSLKMVTRATTEYFKNLSNKLRNPFVQLFLRCFNRRRFAKAMKAILYFDELNDSLDKGNDPILYHAPLLILFHARTSQVFANVNANLALHNAALAAETLGLGTVYSGYVVAAAQRSRELNRNVSLPPDHTIWGGLAVGYPAEKFDKWIERHPRTVRSI